MQARPEDITMPELDRSDDIYLPFWPLPRELDHPAQDLLELDLWTRDEESFVRELESTHAETLETIAPMDARDADAAMPELDHMESDMWTGDDERCPWQLELSSTALTIADKTTEAAKAQFQTSLLEMSNFKIVALTNGKPTLDINE